jgi:hypothetical protein
LIVPRHSAEEVGAGAGAPNSNSGVALEEKLKSLINKQKVMLFMKGNPTNPRCGFSRKVVDMLKQSK